VPGRRQPGILLVRTFLPDCYRKVNIPMPNLIPISLGCVAMEINVGPTSDWYPPEKKPYRTATTTDPADVPAPKTEKARIQDPAPITTRRFRLPK
jgi:hypothetical protein